MPNLIKSLTRDYFNSYFNGSAILHKGAVLQILEADNNNVLAEDLATNTSVRIPNDYFTGFGVFKYPLLGYRRFGEHRIGYMTRKQSVHRGLRAAHINVAWSAATRLLVDLAAVPVVRLSDSEKVIAAFIPKFDTLKDVPDLLAGNTTGLVLSENLIIEPSTEAADEWYSVVYKQAVVGKVDSKGAVTWNDKGHEHLLPARLVE